MIASCASMSTVIFNNLFVAMTLLQALRGNLLLSTFSVAIATYLTVYPVALLVPIIVITVNLRSSHGARLSTLSIIVRVLIYFMSWIAVLFYASYSFMGDTWHFLERAYLYPLQAGDLTPNWGNWWYFFTETFDHFRAYFLLAFHAHILAYIVPLTIRFHSDGLFLGVIFTAIIGLFKPYPTFADVFFYITLLLIYVHLSQRKSLSLCHAGVNTICFIKSLSLSLLIKSTAFTTDIRYGFFIVALIVYSMVLGPVFYNTWVYKGTGNANFFYFVTLVFLLAQILLIIEYLLAKQKFMDQEKKDRKAVTKKCQ